MPQIKAGAVTCSYPDNFAGDVEIVRGDVAVTVPMDVFVRVVAEKVRAERIAVLERAKPSDLISKFA